MQFTPKSEKDLQNSNLLQPGIYEFQVIEAKERLSKSGNEMLELQLKIFGQNGYEPIIYDYLLEAMSYKLKHFAEHTGLLDKYNSGLITAEDCVGKIGNANIIIQEGQ